MLEGLINVAAGIRHRNRDDGRLDQLEQRIVSRLGLLAHVVIRSGSEPQLTPLSASEGVARDAIDGLARAVGFAADLAEIVDYGVMLVLIAVHVCRQTNLKGDDVLDHVRRLLQEAALAVPALTPPPSFADGHAVRTETSAVQAGLMSGRDPTWSLISSAIAALRAEFGQVQIPSELQFEDLPPSDRTTTPKAPDRLLLTDGHDDDDDGRDEPGSESPIRLAMNEIQAPVLPLLDDGRDCDDGGCLSSARATVATSEMGSAIELETSSPANDDHDTDRCLHEILTVLARLQTGQDHLNEELRQLRQTIEEASVQASHVDNNDRLSGLLGKKPVIQPWQRLRKARISEIDTAQVASLAARSSGLKIGEGIEIETPDDPWSDADPDRPSYRPGAPAVQLQTTPQSKRSTLTEEAAVPPSQATAGDAKPDRIHDVLRNILSDERLDKRRTSAAAARPPSESSGADRPASAALINDDSGRHQRSRSHCPAYCSCGQQTTRAPPRCRDRTWTESTSTRLSSIDLTSSDVADDDDDRRRRRLRRRSPRRHPRHQEQRPLQAAPSHHVQYDDVRLGGRHWLDSPPPSRRSFGSHGDGDASASRRSTYSDSVSAAPWWSAYRPGGRARSAFPDCCLKLGTAPQFDRYPVRSWSPKDPYRYGHLNCRYCQIEQLGMRLSRGCQFCP